MTDTKKALTLLFDRPKEPIFMPKGDNNTVFDVSPEFLPPKYENLTVELSNRFGEEAGEKIPLRSVNLPDLSVASQLPREADFSLFIPRHQACAGALVDIFLSVPEGDLEELLATAAICRERVNSQLFNYCLSVALLHRPDTRDVPLPNFMESFPASFLDSKTFQQAREVANVVPAPLRTPIIIPREFTASDLEEEHRLAYFREDLGINLHHWHWHLVYPFTSVNRAVVDKDRRGELFYFMHQQILARYNAERLCNNLQRVKRFNNFRGPIAEAYYPKLDSLTSARTWPPRQAGMAWTDLNRPVDDIIISVETLEQWKNRLDEAISSGFVQLTNGETMPLTIDLLGNMVEASDLSPNQEYYGGFHNNGHLLTAYIHDPEHKYLERFGVMADEATTMRDPFFYRWHAQIDSLFQKFKGSNAVSPYGVGRLGNQDVTVSSLQVIPDSGQPNAIGTFWMQSDVDLSRGLDFSDRGPVYVRFTHLNHTPFTYNIEVENAGEAKRGTVRIFMSPKLDERGLPWTLTEQRLMMIEMDRFATELNSGANTVTRRSDESSVTIPFERTFRNLSGNPRDETDVSTSFNFCGCGWPQHMLIPKGSPQGTPCDFFVMVSNYEQDRVDQEIDGIPCSDASSFCGIKDRLYPDRRDMGFPFDRPPRTEYATLQDFLQPNMAVQDVTITFSDRTVPNPRNPKN